MASTTVKLSVETRDRLLAHGGETYEATIIEDRRSVRRARVIRSGDVHLADVNDEVRRRVLVVSNDQFNAVSGRALVAPEVLFPWRVRIDDAVYAVDLARSFANTRLLERIDRAPVATMASVRQALLHIT